MNISEYESLLATLEVMEDAELQRDIRRGLRDEATGRLYSWEEVFGDDFHSSEE